MIELPRGSMLYGEDLSNLPKAAPYLDIAKHMQIMADGTGYMLFDSEEEMDHIYYQTVGDDGPTKLNPYNGSIKIYALTCNPDGQTMNENT